jgi:hypothetical protein
MVKLRRLTKLTKLWADSLFDLGLRSANYIRADHVLPLTGTVGMAYVM